MNKKIRKVLAKLIDPSECQVGRRYYWVQRIEGVDWNDFSNYDNLECYFVGWCIGFDGSFPIFVSNLDASPEAMAGDISNCLCTDPARWCVDFIEQAMLEAHNVESIYGYPGENSGQ